MKSIEQYEISGISYMSQQLITLREAKQQELSLYYLEWLDENTLGYISNHEVFNLTKFVPVCVDGMHIRISK